MIKKLFGGFIQAAKTAGQAKKAFDDLAAKAEAFGDDLDDDQVAEKDEIIAGLQELKSEVPAQVKKTIQDWKPIVLKAKAIGLKAWVLGVHVFNAHAGDKK